VLAALQAKLLGLSIANVDQGVADLAEHPTELLERRPKLRKPLRQRRLDVRRGCLQGHLHPADGTQEQACLVTERDRSCAIGFEAREQLRLEACLDGRWRRLLGRLGSVKAIDRALDEIGEVALSVVLQQDDQPAGGGADAARANKRQDDRHAGGRDQARNDHVRRGTLQALVPALDEEPDRCAHLINVHRHLAHPRPGNPSAPPRRQRGCPT
jgi:hypothetical protein